MSRPKGVGRQDCIRHVLDPGQVRPWMDTDYSHLRGSVEFNDAPPAEPVTYGISQVLSRFTFDPRDSRFLNLPPTTINPGSFVDLTCRVQGSLESGLCFSGPSGVVGEAPRGRLTGHLEQLASTTGETAPVEVHQGFSIKAMDISTSVTVTGTVGAGGIDVFSWQEF